MVQEMFDNLEFPLQPKNTIKFTLINNETGEIDKEVTIENTVCAIFASAANQFYKLMAVGGYDFGFDVPVPGGSSVYLVLRSWNPGVSGNNYYLTTYEGYYPFYAPNDAIDSTQGSTFYVYDVVDSTHLYVLYNTSYSLLQAGDTITQGSNTTTITSVVDANHIQVASTAGWVGQLNDTRIWTAFNLNNAITTSGTQGGIYLPQLSGPQRNRSYTWTYEWGTTQGNGVISSVAYQSGDNTPAFSQGASAIMVGVTPELVSSNQWTYAGWKTVGPSLQLYFVNRSLATNNVTILNYSDFSLVNQYTMTNPGVADVGGAEHDIIYTPVGGGQFYAFVSAGPHSLVFQTAAESSSMTFGAPITVSGITVPGWYNGGSFTVRSFTSDQTYIYALLSDNQNIQQAVLTFDPSTNTVVSIVKLPAGQGGFSGTYTGYLFNICPVTGKVFHGTSDFYVVEWPSITQPGLQRQSATLQAGTPTYYYPTFMMEQNTDRLVMTYFDQQTVAYYGAWFELTKGEFMTYSELPSPITKTGTQSLRVSYTLNFA